MAALAHDMDDPAPHRTRAGCRPAWRFLIRPRWLGWHLLMVVSFLGMLWLGDWQFHRALSGNGLSWAYTFEWPLFAGFPSCSGPGRSGMSSGSSAAR